MKISKRKLQQLRSISVGDGVLQYYGYTFFENSPDEWGNFEKQLYDLVNEVETRMLSAILAELGAAESCGNVGEQPTTEQSVAQG